MYLIFPLLLSCSFKEEIIVTYMIESELSDIQIIYNSAKENNGRDRVCTEQVQFFPWQKIIEINADPCSDDYNAFIDISGVSNEEGCITAEIYLQTEYIESQLIESARSCGFNPSVRIKKNIIDDDYHL